MHSDESMAGRVLLIEDDPFVAMVLEEILGHAGLETAVDLSVCDALTEIDAGEFDVVLLDMELRGESARPVLLALMERKLPFFVISGHDQTELRKEFPQITVLVKPLNRTELIRKMRLLLNQA